MMRFMHDGWLVKYLPIGAVISVVAFLIGAVLLINTVRNGNQERDQICRVAQRDNTTLRGILLLAQKNARVSLKNDPARLRVSQRFYRQALGLLKPVDCEKL
jgi:hypothetical protein